MKETSREYIDQELVDHLDQYKNNPVVRKALSREPTFWDQVKEFYDLDNLGSSEITDFAERNKKRDQKELRGSHEDLVNILTPFTEQQLRPFHKYFSYWTEEADITKLSYEAVREDTRRIRDSNAKGMSLRAIWLALIHEVTYGIFKQKEESSPFGEYGILGHLAQHADSFLDHTYRAHFMRRQFSDDSEGQI
jgi:hypothetical protein